MAEYQELRLRFERIGEAADYRVFASGPAGEAAGTFRSPYSDVEIENLVLKLSRPRSGVRRIDSSDLELVRGFGGGLFDAVFNGRVRDVYRSSLASARNEGCGMRISLALTGTPELMPVPWEYLYDDPAFLSISMWTPVVRYLDLASTRRPLKVEPPLRILGMVSSPSDIAQLDVAQERAKLEESLAGLAAQGAVEISWLEQATLQALQRELRRGDFHVFHYIGHGGYDRASDDGVLALEDATGRSRLVSGMELGTILADEMSLRLAVLNACEGARSSVDDPFSGVATSLVRREIPAVIAMQLEITDRAAITFASELYAALADGYAVDAALAEARKAIFADENEVEWATPVLFMRVPDGRIFDVQAPLAVHTPVVEPAIGVEADPPAWLAGETAPTVAEAAVLPDTPAPAEVRAPEPIDETPTPPAPTEVRAPEPIDETPAPGKVEQPLPARVLVALVVCTAVLLAAIVVPWDTHKEVGRSFVRPFFGRLSNHDGGFFTALSPAAVVLVAVVATWLAWRGRRPRLAAGLLIGCGLAATAKYLGLVARVVTEDERRGVSIPFFFLALAASFVVLLIGMQLAQLAAVRLGKAPLGEGAMARALVGAGAVLVLIGCLVPFNYGGDSGTHRAILPDENSLALDPLIVGFALLIASLGLRYVPRALGAGIVVALAVESAALWLRYVGVPIAQPDNVGSSGPGGFIGLAGALIALGVGLSLARRRASASPPAP